MPRYKQTARKSMPSSTMVMQRANASSSRAVEECDDIEIVPIYNMINTTYNGKIHKWVVFNYSDEIQKKTLIPFLDALEAEGSSYGMTISNPLEIRNSNLCQPKQEFPKVVAKYPDLQMIMCVLGKYNAIYDLVKEVGDSLNIVTKCIMEQSVRKKTPEIFKNNLIKINTTVGKQSLKNALLKALNEDEVMVKEVVGTSKEPKQTVSYDTLEKMESYHKDVSSSSMEDEETTDSSENKSEEKEIYYIDAIKNILGIVDSSGTFACSLQLNVKEVGNLQLSINGVGKINLPLSDKQGTDLKSKSTAAPYGHGRETLIKKSVRDAWQIDAKDVTLNNEFNKLIKQKISEIIPILMGESFTEIKQVESNLYKLVYYEIGGHFVAHRDTEKAPGMFATFVVQLPASYEGGELIVRHKEETKVFDFENDSKDNFFFTAFFTDCEHELRKIHAGHRLVLIYNLVHKNSHLTLDHDNDTKPHINKRFIPTMRNSVKKWKSDKKGPQYLVLKLDHLYTNTNTSLKNLKGKDKNIADVLCSCADIEVYIATITKKEKRLGYDNYPVRGCEPEVVSEDEDWFEIVCSYTLNNWKCVNNNVQSFDFGELELHKNEMLIKEDCMFQKDEVRCNSEYEYTGNEGCNINYFYEKKALVFWPKGNKMMFSCDSNLSSALANCKKLSESKRDEALEMLKEILLYIEKRHEKAMKQLLDINIVARIFEIIILFEDKIRCQANTFLLALIKPYRSDNSTKEKVGLPNINSAVALANLIDKLSWENLGNSVLKLVKETASSHTESCAQLVISLLSLGLHEQAISIVEVATTQIIAQSDDLSIEGVTVWSFLLVAHNIFSSCFDDFLKQLSKITDYALIEIILKMHNLLNPKVINQYRIKKCFQSFLIVLQSIGWIGLSLKSVTLLCPIVLFADNFNSNICILSSFVQAVIDHENSSNFLKALLKLPIVIEAKDTPSVQLMVQKRLEQLDVRRSTEAKNLVKIFCEPKKTVPQKRASK